MKEIIYIQAGPFANYIGTHFWNTQESYFTYDDNEEADINHDVSFREGLNHKGEPTYCPRLLLFDRKANFGTLSSSGGLYGDQDELDDDAQDSLWSGSVDEYRQDRIRKSSYHAHLDDADSTPQVDKPESVPSQAAVRYWSDYSRTFFHPRSLQRLPDLAEWENPEGDWNQGRETFERHDHASTDTALDTSLMEDSFRLSVEECDHLQGIQVLNETATFGGFIDAFLTSFRDEFPKLACLSFPLLSNSAPRKTDADDDLSLRRTINDALCLRSLDTLASMSVPLQTPSLWAPGPWLDGTSVELRSIYHTSAVLSAHIESATLPLRWKGSADDMASICGMLNWGDSGRFAHLSGALPLSSPLAPERDLAERLHDFTSDDILKDNADTRIEYARLYVARGLSPMDRRAFDRWTEPHRPIPYRQVFTSITECGAEQEHSIYAPAYPTPTSFPSFFTASPQKSYHGTPAISALSSLHTTPRTAQLFAAYAKLVEDSAHRKADVLGAMGLEKDEVKELGDSLWAMRDAYAGAEDVLDGEDEELGEDEE
ncbi:tubulin nucleotide-binding domain-like protein [Wolfiporia cocos MD-104 SS10]|uniref:Tubulin nucleotide-binding domain-like protein n=1 Tax=Wolfiporia cocos (strain MD-104) TaxID=742152 RepID=A0A2H3JL43_WOLCO|nr:tubulin nucleotide-binding domain-like protein [Wolfiporia cocos MD-104 SS10]